MGPCLPCLLSSLPLLSFLQSNDLSLELFCVFIHCLSTACLLTETISSLRTGLLVSICWREGGEERGRVEGDGRGGGGEGKRGGRREGRRASRKGGGKGGRREGRTSPGISSMNRSAQSSSHRQKLVLEPWSRCGWYPAGVPLPGLHTPPPAAAPVGGYCPMYWTYGKRAVFGCREPLGGTCLEVTPIPRAGAALG